MRHKISFQYKETCFIINIDISASDEIFRLCFAVRMCRVASTGNSLASTFYWSFHKEGVSVHVT